MFILRQIATNKVDRNEILGNEYYHIDRFVSYPEFCKSFKSLFEEDHVADLDDTSTTTSKNCYGFISYAEGSKLMPLFKDSKYYIMTDSGKTFQKIGGIFD